MRTKGRGHCAPTILNTELITPNLRAGKPRPYNPEPYNVDDMENKETDHRPWGYYEVLKDEPFCKVKKIVVYPGKRLSLQRHRRRSEHWFVVQGLAAVTLDDAVLQLLPVRQWISPAGQNTGLPIPQAKSWLLLKFRQVIILVKTI